MPSNKQRLVGALASVGITIGGAWLASQLRSPPTSASVPQALPDGGLVVNIDKLRNSSGNVVIMVFDNDEAYRNYDFEKAVGYLERSAQEAMQVSFPDLQQGPYVITSFHDENGNREFDTQGTTPKEGYATSGASDAYDTPSFKKASIYPGVIWIEMHYLD